MSCDVLAYCQWHALCSLCASISSAWLCMVLPLRFDLGILVVQLVLYQLLLYVILRVKYEHRSKK